MIITRKYILACNTGIYVALLNDFLRFIFVYIQVANAPLHFTNHRKTACRYYQNCYICLAHFMYNSYSLCRSIITILRVHAHYSR